LRLLWRACGQKRGRRCKLTLRGGFKGDLSETEEAGKGAPYVGKGNQSAAKRDRRTPVRNFNCEGGPTIVRRGRRRGRRQTKENQREDQACSPHFGLLRKTDHCAVYPQREREGKDYRGRGASERRKRREGVPVRGRPRNQGKKILRPYKKGKWGR